MTFHVTTLIVVVVGFGAASVALSERAASTRPPLGPASTSGVGGTAPASSIGASPELPHAPTADAATNTTNQRRAVERRCRTRGKVTLRTTNIRAPPWVDS